MQTNVLQCLQNLSRLHSTEKKNNIKSETLNKKKLKVQILFLKYKTKVMMLNLSSFKGYYELLFSPTPDEFT